MWENEIQTFGHYLRIERGLSGHSLEAYIRDIRKLATYLTPLQTPVLDVKENQILDFLKDLHSLGIEASTQSRCLSGIRSFFQYLVFEGRIPMDPKKGENYRIHFHLMKSI
jgi:integrase/recombinase XerD